MTITITTAITIKQQNYKTLRLKWKWKIYQNKITIHQHKNISYNLCLYGVHLYSNLILTVSYLHCFYGGVPVIRSHNGMRDKYFWIFCMGYWCKVPFSIYTFTFFQKLLCKEPFNQGSCCIQGSYIWSICLFRGNQSHDLAVAKATLSNWATGTIIIYVYWNAMDWNGLFY